MRQLLQLAASGQQRHSSARHAHSIEQLKSDCSVESNSFKVSAEMRDDEINLITTFARDIDDCVLRRKYRKTTSK